MRRVWMVAITAGALVLAPACQSSGGGPSDSSASELAGSDVVAELNHSVDAGKAKLGDIVKATVTQDVLSHGRIVIRRGSKLLGHVTQIKARSKDDQESRLGLVFDKAVLKGGGEIDFMAAIKALAPAVRVGAVDQPDPMAPTTAMPARTTSPAPISGGMSSNNRMNTSSAASNSPTNLANQANRVGEMVSASTSTGNHPANETGLMGGGSRGVFGLPGLHLAPESGGGRGTVVTSIRNNVKLPGGTQMVIQINNVSQ